MRLMSFMLTTEQVRNRTKTVTRRLGWKTAKAGDIVQPIVKGQGLKKGEKAERIGGPIRFVKVDREPLTAMQSAAYGGTEAALEGVGGMSGWQFVAMFCEHNACTPDTEVTRIEFEYVGEK
jgi:hypothetical protein